MLLDPASLLILVGGTLFAFTVSTTLGLGGGVLMLPPMLMVYDTPTAIAMIAPLMLVNAVGKIWVFRRDLDLGLALWLGLLSWPLALIAGFSVDQVDARYLKGGIVMLIGLMLGIEHGLGRKIQVTWRGLQIWGAATGILAGLTGVSGPTLALALKGHGVEGRAFVAVVATVVLGLQVLRLPAYVASGLLPESQVPMLVTLGAVAMTAIALGRRVQRHLSVARWRSALDVLLFGVAVWLSADVLGLISR